LRVISALKFTLINYYLRTPDISKFFLQKKHDSGPTWETYTQFSLQGLNLITDQPSGKVEQGQRAWSGVGEGKNLFQLLSDFEGGFLLEGGGGGRFLGDYPQTLFGLINFFLSWK